MHSMLLASDSNKETKTMTTKNVNRTALLFGFFLLSVTGLIAVSTAAAPPAGGVDTSLQQECSEQLQKLMTCLDYAKGSTATPSSQCCGSVKDIKDKDPKCLCLIIQQAHSSSSEMVKNFGIQEAKLLQLPSACQLKNASISDCPKLLGISPSSPEAAIFSGNASTTGTPPATPEKADSSDGTRQETYLVGPMAVIALAIFFYAFPTGATCVFYKWD